jgi:hypothetical protein
VLDDAGNLSRFTATFEESWHEDVASDARVRALRAVSVRNRAALEICPNRVRTKVPVSAVSAMVAFLRRRECGARPAVVPSRDRSDEQRQTVDLHQPTRVSEQVSLSGSGLRAVAPGPQAEPTREPFDLNGAVPCTACGGRSAASERAGRRALIDWRRFDETLSTRWTARAPCRARRARGAGQAGRWRAGCKGEARCALPGVRPYGRRLEMAGKEASS